MQHNKVLHNLLIFGNYYDFLGLLFSLPITTENIFDLITKSRFNDTEIINQLYLDLRGIRIKNETDEKICPITLEPIQSPAYLYNTKEQKLYPRRFEHMAIREFLKLIDTPTFFHPTTNEKLIKDEIVVHSDKPQSILIQRSSPVPNFPHNIKVWSFHTTDTIDTCVLTHYILILLARQQEYFWVFVALLNANKITSLPDSLYHQASNETLAYLSQRNDIFQRSDTHSLETHKTSQSLLAGNVNDYCCYRLLFLLSDQSQCLQSYLFISDLFVALLIMLPDSPHQLSFFDQQSLTTLIYCLLKADRFKSLSQLIPLVSDPHLFQLLQLLTSDNIDNSLKTHVSLLTSYVVLSSSSSYSVSLLLIKLVKNKFSQLLANSTQQSFSSGNRCSLWHKDIIVIHYDEKTHQVLSYDLKPDEKSFNSLRPIYQFDKVLVKEFDNHFITIYGNLVYTTNLYSLFFDKDNKLLLISRNRPSSLSHLVPSPLESFKILITQTINREAPIIVDRSIVWFKDEKSGLLTHQINFSSISSLIVETPVASYKDLISLFCLFQKHKEVAFSYDHLQELTIHVDTQGVLHLQFYSTDDQLFDFTEQTLCSSPLSPIPLPVNKTPHIARNFNSIANFVKSKKSLPEIIVPKRIHDIFTLPESQMKPYQIPIVKNFKKHYRLLCKTENSYYHYQLFQ